MPFRPEDFSDEQEVVRSISDLKKYASINWWSGFGSGVAAIAIVIGLLLFVGLYYNI